MFLHPVIALTLARERQRQHFIATQDPRLLILSAEDARRSRHLRSGRRGP